MLSTQLTEQLEAIQSLQETLEEETTCLKEKNFTHLNTILYNKQQLLKTITERDKALSTVSSQNQIAEDENLLALKNDIEKQLADCQKTNNLNGQLIELSMKSNKHLMQLMKHATGKNSVTYDRKGALNSGSLLGRNIKA